MTLILTLVLICALFMVVVLLEIKKKDIKQLFLFAAGAIIVSAFLELLKLTNESELMAEVAYLIFAIVIIGSGIGKLVFDIRRKISSSGSLKKKV